MAPTSTPSLGGSSPTTAPVSCLPCLQGPPPLGQCYWSGIPWPASLGSLLEMQIAGPPRSTGEPWNLILIRPPDDSMHSSLRPTSWRTGSGGTASRTPAGPLTPTYLAFKASQPVSQGWSTVRKTHKLGCRILQAPCGGCFLAGRAWFLPDKYNNHGAPSLKPQVSLSHSHRARGETSDVAPDKLCQECHFGKLIILSWSNWETANARVLCPSLFTKQSLKFPSWRWQ